VTEDRLSRALGAWASARRLEDQEGDRMRTAILLTPAVDALWWDQFNQQMARLAARVQTPRGSEPSASGWAERPRLSWGAGAQAVYE
jgi:hypothetical protein